MSEAVRDALRARCAEDMGERRPDDAREPAVEREPRAALRLRALRGARLLRRAREGMAT